MDYTITRRGHDPITFSVVDKEVVVYLTPQQLSFSEKKSEFGSGFFAGVISVMWVMICLAFIIGVIFK